MPAVNVRAAAMRTSTARSANGAWTPPIDRPLDAVGGAAARPLEAPIPCLGVDLGLQRHRTR
eukprot:6310466-Lingulodinium_polyedra.AAC.1